MIFQVFQYVEILECIIRKPKNQIDWVYLRLVPAEKLIASDPFEINGRIVLGSLFSMVLSVSILADDVNKFFVAVIDRTDLSAGVGLLIPFFVGYAITLALAFMQKLMTALEIAFSLEQINRQRPVRSRSRD